MSSHNTNTHILFKHRESAPLHTTFLTENGLRNILKYSYKFTGHPAQPVV